MMKRANRFLAMLLCAALIFGMVPGVTAFAEEEDEAVVQETEATVQETEASEETEATEETVAETTEATLPQETTGETIPEETVEETIPEETAEETIPEETAEETIPEETVEETIPEETMEFLEKSVEMMLTAADIGDSFTTFEELQVLAGESYDTYTGVTYVGSEPLEITEDLTIPQYLQVNAENSEVIVDSGVTLNIAGYLYCQTLTINGTVNAEGNFDVKSALTVNGKLHFTGWGYVGLEYPATITGEENITSSGSNAYINWSYTIKSQEELDQCLEVISGTTNSYSQHTVVICSDLSLGDVTLPENVSAFIQEGYTATVPQGTTLTIGRNLVVNGTLKVDGEVIVKPNAYLNVSNGTFSYGSFVGRVEVSESGNLSIQGYFSVTTPLNTQKEDLSKFLIGLDSSKYLISQSWIHEETVSWTVQSTEGLTKLGTPTELKWGYEVRWSWNSETGTSKLELVAKPGSMYWKTAEPDQGNARIAIYREGEVSPVYSTSWRFGSVDLPEHRSTDDFIKGDYESGTYYFTVTSEGDGTAYYNSDTATSEKWTYTRPEAQLGVCDNLSWNWPAASWTSPENSGGYCVKYYYAPTETGTPREAGETWGYDNVSSIDIYDECVQRNGAGYYYFRVRALSPDITQYRNGEWSQMSEAYCLTETTESVNNNLDTILNNETEPEAIKNAVQAIETEDLKSAMLADQGDSGTVAKLEELERKVGTTVVEVTNEASDFDQTRISIVGASLNEVVDNTQDVKLIVDKPEKDNVIPAQYDNSVAVKFSMGLENVQNEENLAVPVKITLPVPSTINPDFLVVLHYHPDGSYEEVHPYVYQSDGAFYASFVLDRFSDFVMTEFKQHVHGEEFTLVEEKEATCTEAGNKAYYLCSCGEVVSFTPTFETTTTLDQVIIPALGHDWGEWTVTKEACCKDGEREHTCKRCGVTEKEVIPATGEHKWSEWEITTPATCEEKGTQTRTCSVCGETESKTDIPALGHDWGEWTVTKEASCKDGEREHTCKRCGAKEKEVIPATGEHKWGEWKITTPATCEEKGTQTRTCSVCGETESKTDIPALGHDWGEWVKVDDNNHARTCKRPGCGKKETEAHTWDEEAITKEPTCGDKGEKTYTCKCGATKTEEIPATGAHTYENGKWEKNDAETHKMKCDNCDHYKTEKHHWDEGVVQEGFRVYTCKDCQETKQEAVIAAPAKPYKIANVVSGVHVYWRATEGAEKYGLWRSENGVNGTYKWIANPTVPHFTDTKVESGKTYYYKVTSMGANGKHSEKSEAIGLTYVSTPDITSRRNIAAGVELGWEKIEGATGYAIYRKSYDGTDAWVRIGTISGNDTFTWTDTSMKNNNGEVCRYTIRALAGSNMKTLSGCRNTGRTMVRLSSQVLRSVAKASATSAKCTWTTSSRVTGYEMRFMVGDTVYKTFTVGNWKTGVKTFTGLKAGQVYTVQVRTYKKVDGVGSFYSDWSSPKTVNLK